MLCLYPVLPGTTVPICLLCVYDVVVIIMMKLPSCHHDVPSAITPPSTTITKKLMNARQNFSGTKKLFQRSEVRRYKDTTRYKHITRRSDECIILVIRRCIGRHTSEVWMCVVCYFFEYMNRNNNGNGDEHGEE